MFAKKYINRPIMLLLVMSLCVATLSPAVLAANDTIPSETTDEPIYVHSSDFIRSYSAGMSAGNNGVMTVTFIITGTATMERIGATRIEIFENGRLVRTLTHTNNPEMMTNNAVIHTGTFTHQGVAGRTYHAVITFQAGRNGGFDVRTLQSLSAVAR